MYLCFSSFSLNSIRHKSAISFNGCGFYIIKKKTIPKYEGNYQQRQYHQWSKHQRKEKIAPKRKKGANCRAMRQKANAAPPITESTPKKKKPQIKRCKALFSLYTYNYTQRRFKRLKTA